MSGSDPFGFCKKNQRVVFTIYKAGAAFGDTVHSTTDDYGRVAVPNAINVTDGDTMSVHSASPNGWLAYWKGVAASSVKIKMQRLDANYNYYELLEGGTVSATISPDFSDRAVLVSFQNLPTAFFEMVLTESPAAAGRDMLIPPKFAEATFPHNNPTIIFPTPGRKYYYQVAPYAIKGTFSLDLTSDNQTLKSTWAKVENEYFDFTCTRITRPLTPQGHTGSCTGSLILYTPYHQSIETHGAESGENLMDGDTFYPALPNGTYTFSETLDMSRSGMRDNFGNCWWAPFNEAPQDNNAIPARPRTELGMHPRGGDMTHGCIGFDPTFDSRDFRRTLDNLATQRGTVKVIVH